MSTFWNQRYAEPGYKYGTKPNAFLVGQAHRLRAGASVLLPGDGEGRNSVWLAARGHPVLAVDSSQVGLDKARHWAEAQGSAVAGRWQGLRADLTEWQPEAGSVDAVVMSYVHVPDADRRPLRRRLAAALAPGGVWIEEGFHPRQLAFHSGGPRDPDMLITLADLRRDLGETVNEVLGWEGEIELDEGSGHQGPAFVTRWVAARIR